MTENKAPNYYVRTLIVFLCIGLAILIAYNVFWIEPKGELNSGIFILLGLLIVLVLSESFDNFSVGKLLTISKEAKKKETEKKELERKNEQLLNQILTISNTQHQTQNHTNVYGDFYSEDKRNTQRIEPNRGEVQQLLDVIGNSQMIQEVENSIIVELEAKNLTHDSDSEKVLIRHLAGTQIVLEFERIHHLIFGSQIRLLKELNVSIPNGKPEGEVFNGIDRVIQSNLEILRNWTKEQYLSFLYESTLIVKNENETIHITVKGVEFLSWMVRNGVNEDLSL
jgi:hypothetical protein